MIVGAPGAGTTTLLRTILLALCILRSPQRVNFIVAEGKPGGNGFADAAELPHCIGHVTFAADQKERLARRLAKVLIGEVANEKT